VQSFCCGVVGLVCVMLDGVLVGYYFVAGFVSCVGCLLVLFVLPGVVLWWCVVACVVCICYDWMYLCGWFGMTTIVVGVVFVGTSGCCVCCVGWALRWGGLLLSFGCWILFRCVALLWLSWFCVLFFLVACSFFLYCELVIY